MTQEAYVSFEVAKLLKERGFVPNLIDVNGIDMLPLHAHEYTTEGKEVWGCYHPDYYPCPTQQMVMRWLREEKDIDVLPECSLVDRKYPFLIINQYSTGGEIIHGDELFDKYEDAVEAALKYCLTELI